MAPNTTPYRIGRALLIAFCVAAATVAGLASFTMLVTGTPFDDIWKAKEHDYQQMLPHRIPIGLGFALLAVLLALAAIGWIRRRRWAWLLTAIMIGAHLAADLVMLVISRTWTNVGPVAIEALVLTWLLLPRTRSGILSTRDARTRA